MSRTSREQRAQYAAETADKLASLTQPQAAEPAAEQVEKTGETRESEPNGRIELRNEPRDRGMDEILKARGQLDDDPEKKTEPEPEKPAPKAPEAEPKPEAPAEPAAEPAAVEPAPEPVKTVRVKVDGEEFDVPQADVDDAGSIANYQRERAAENRLRKTNEALAETRKVQVEIANWMAQNTPKPATQTDDEFITSRMDLIRYGSSEESAKAMQEVLARSNRKIDPNMVSAMAVNQVNENMAVKDFGKEFADIAASPLLLKLAITLEHERKRGLRQVPDWPTFYRSIGNEVRSVTGRPHQPAQTQAAADSTSRPTKEERKSSIVNLPTAAARAALPEAEKPETREDVLNELRRARGIPTG